MFIFLVNRKPKTQRAKRALEKRESKIHENDKIAMFIKGGRTSEQVSQALKDLVSLCRCVSSFNKSKISLVCFSLFLLSFAYYCLVCQFNPIE